MQTWSQGLFVDCMFSLFAILYHEYTHGFPVNKMPHSIYFFLLPITYLLSQFSVSWFLFFIFKIWQILLLKMITNPDCLKMSDSIFLLDLPLCHVMSHQWNLGPACHVSPMKSSASLSCFTNGILGQLVMFHQWNLGPACHVSPMKSWASLSCLTNEILG